jgi:anti-sigma regulatory factor (Ser/Thr protein kinase)
MRFVSPAARAEAVTEARHRADQWAAAAGMDDDLRFRVALIVSELATNAIRHARSAFALRIHPTDASMRIEVFDTDQRHLPQPLDADRNATGGRGLNLVISLSDEWGIDLTERNGTPGKVVWAVCSAR